jgi:hypothetical protein
MQPNTIAYTYDHDNDGGTTAAVSVTLTRHADELNKSTYRTASHNDTVQQDLLSFYRTAAKRSGEFLGTEKTAIKRTKTVIVKNASGLDVKAPSIVNLDFSLPYGMTIAQKLATLMETIGYLSSTEGKAAMIKLLNVQEI